MGGRLNYGDNFSILCPFFPLSLFYQKEKRYRSSIILVREFSTGTLEVFDSEASRMCTQ